MRRSLRDPIARSAYEGAAEGHRRLDYGLVSKNVTFPLSDPTDPAHAGFRDTVLRNVAGNESILDEYKGALPSALTEIARQTPTILGLVRGARGRGATALTKNLANRRVGNGFAYELLGTAALIQQNRVKGAGSKPTNGGRTLQIFSTDRIDLGVRMPAQPGANDPEKGYFRPASPRSPGKFRATFEADLMITREDGPFRWHTIGVDFKHAKQGGSYASDTRNTQSQLEAVANGIMRGEMNMTEFHYATNGVFHPDFKASVDAMNAHINEQMGRSEDQPPLICVHERHQYPLG
jgi:hypothetical protein